MLWLSEEGRVDWIPMSMRRYVLCRASVLRSTRLQLRLQSRRSRSNREGESCGEGCEDRKGLSMKKKIPIICIRNTTFIFKRFREIDDESSIFLDLSLSNLYLRDLIIDNIPERESARKRERERFVWVSFEKLLLRSNLSFVLVELIHDCLFFNLLFFFFFLMKMITAHEICLILILVLVLVLIFNVSFFISFLFGLWEIFHVHYVLFQQKIPQIWRNVHFRSCWGEGDDGMMS